MSSSANPPRPVTFEEARAIVNRHIDSLAVCWSPKGRDDHGRIHAFLNACEAERKRARELVARALQVAVWSNDDEAAIAELRAFLEETKP